MISIRLTAGLILACAYLAPASAGSNPYIGEIMLTGAVYCPRGWAEAAGQMVPISQNQALYSVYGTTYGGDGSKTFALPDLRGRIAMGQGAGTGLTPRNQGQMTGTETTTLTISQMPPHNHILTASTAAPNTGTAANNSFAQFAGTSAYTSTVSPRTIMAQQTIAPAGGGAPFSTMQPSLTLRYCVALIGEYPPRP